MAQMFLKKKRKEKKPALIYQPSRRILRGKGWR
jgi:hypothetical protein